jgi:hypothetical protein
VDLPADDGGLTQRVLTALHRRWPAVDLTTFNPARIWKLYGTPACKGDSTADRPHRMARLVNVPAELRPVSRELLELLAGPAPKPETNGHQKSNGHHGARFDIWRWLADHGVEHAEPRPWDGAGKKAELRRCPFSTAHIDGAFVGERGNGAIVVKCQHKSCTGFGWHDLREQFEPGFRDRRNAYHGNGHHETACDDEPTPDVDHHDRRPAPAKPVVYTRLTCGELDQGAYSIEFLVDRLLVAGQPCIIAGGKKTLKTSLLIDLGLSLATGRDFLGRFRVNRSANVALMTGESGLATIQETARRIAIAKGLRLADVSGLIFSPDLPRFGDLRHTEALCGFVTADEIEVVIVDPAYLALATDGNESSLFAVGHLLRGMVEACNSVGAMILLAHHTKKTITDPYAPPELEHIAWAGFPEFARQWILIGRRDAYEPGTGQHRLWLNVGGSAGHSGCYAVDIAEGVYDGLAPRRWELEVKHASEARDDATAKQEQAKEAKRKSKADATLDDDRRAIVRAMAKMTPDTQKAVKERVGIRADRFGHAWASLLDDGTIETGARVTKGNKQTYEAYRLRQENGA